MTTTSFNYASSGADRIRITYIPMLRVILPLRAPFFSCSFSNALILTVLLFYEECPMVSEIDSVVDDTFFAFRQM